MKIYLAARYSRRLELCGYRAQLREMGHSVTSRWLNGAHQIDTKGSPIGNSVEALVEGDDGSRSREAAVLRTNFAHEDVADVLTAECIINFTEPPRSSASRGGRHVELGIVLGLNLMLTAIGAPKVRIIAVGHRENLFHWLPIVEYVDAWPRVVDLLLEDKKKSSAGNRAQAAREWNGLIFRSCRKPKKRYADEGVLSSDVTLAGELRIREYWLRGRFYRRMTNPKRPKREIWMVLRKE